MVQDKPVSSLQPLTSTLATGWTADPAKYIAEALTELVETLPKPTDNGTAKKKKAPARNTRHKRLVFGDGTQL